MPSLNQQRHEWYANGGLRVVEHERLSESRRKTGCAPLQVIEDEPVDNEEIADDRHFRGDDGGTQVPGAQRGQQPDKKNVHDRAHGPDEGEGRHLAESE